jgi:hypothetical protein
MKDQPPSKGRANLLLRAVRKLGPSLSSRVAKEMVKHDGITAENARKIIQRGAPGVSALKRIKFPHNERFLYPTAEFRSSTFWQALILALEEQKTTYGLALAALDAHQNVIPAKRFHVISGSPTLLKGHLASERVLYNLIDIGFIERSTFADLPILHVAPATGLEVGSFQEVKARAVAEGIVLGGLKDWARKMGLASYDKVRTRDEGANPKFGQFEWDLTAPSYVHPFRGFGDGRVLPGFLVADVVLGVDLIPKHILYFVQKATVLLQQRNTRPFMALMIGDRFTLDALRFGRAKGLVLTTPEILFGKEIAQALSELVRTLSNAGAVAKEDPDRIPALFTKLASIEDSAKNLRGPLFEMIVAHVASTSGGSVDVGKIVTSPKTSKQAEIDVLQTRPDIVNVYECKGHLSNTAATLEEVKDWLKRQVPRIRNYLIVRHAHKPQCFQFWTTSSITDEAEAFLQERRAETKKYTLVWKDRKGVLEELRRIQAQNLVNVIKQHYVSKKK